MKTGVLLGFLFLALTGVLSGVFGEVRINEVELNPYGTDSGNELIELYSESLINLSGWNLTNADGEIITLNFDFSNYYTYTFASGWLDNTDENITLINQSRAFIFSTGFLSDSSNDDRTWQYCFGNWNFRNSTKSAENNCSLPASPTCTQNWSCSAWGICSSYSQTRTCADTNNCGNNTGKPAESQSCSSGVSTVDTYIQLNWTDEIYSDEEFEIEVKAFNLLSYEYDLKIWIEFKTNSTMLSERYDSENDEWKSGTYYINRIFSGTGNRTKDINLRMKEDYQDFEGEAKIYAKLRRNDNENIIDDDGRTIEISEKEEDFSTAYSSSSDNNDETTAYSENTDDSDDEIIILGNSESKTTEKTANSIVYKSKMEYIKDYAPYALTAICIFVIVLLMLDKKGRKNKE